MFRTGFDCVVLVHKGYFVVKKNVFDANILVYKKGFDVLDYFFLFQMNIFRQKSGPYLFSFHIYSTTRRCVGKEKLQQRREENYPLLKWYSLDLTLKIFGKKRHFFALYFPPKYCMHLTQHTEQQLLLPPNFAFPFCFFSILLTFSLLSPLL